MSTDALPLASETSLPCHREAGPAGRGDPVSSGLLRRYPPRNGRFVRGRYHVYIVTNRRNGTLYTGVTNDLRRRIWEHRTKALPGFTAQYGLNRLVYFEEYRDVLAAIDREKQIKAGSRAKKLELIERENPNWNDLAAEWFA
jgi:putative endonuclease